MSKFQDRTTGLVCPVLSPAAWRSPGLGEKPQRQKQNLQPWNEAPLNLRCASFLAPLCWVGRAVKGRDERPKTAPLTALPTQSGKCVSIFSLDMGRRLHRWVMRKSNVMSFFGTYRNRNCPLVALLCPWPFESSSLPCSRNTRSRSR